MTSSPRHLKKTTPWNKTSQYNSPQAATRVWRERLIPQLWSYKTVEHCVLDWTTSSGWVHCPRYSAQTVWSPQDLYGLFSLRNSAKNTPAGNTPVIPYGTKCASVLFQYKYTVVACYEWFKLIVKSPRHVKTLECMMHTVCVLDSRCVHVLRRVRRPGSIEQTGCTWNRLESNSHGLQAPVTVP